ncbi:hypothetical protein EB796_018999 [Bugula neritina]|uniref:Uncharacterized protein n=1 Tax=Bugula neritina TaxID=10212 RepID=A0A7J7JAN7_BUGNE|nr:hypothetical protein EB796_018999 [Bugula neritina]
MKRDSPGGFLQSPCDRTTMVARPHGSPLQMLDKASQYVNSSKRRGFHQIPQPPAGANGVQLEGNYSLFQGLISLAQTDLSVKPEPPFQIFHSTSQSYISGFYTVPQFPYNGL